jgi:hypothetical protein
MQEPNKPETITLTGNVTGGSIYASDGLGLAKGADSDDGYRPTTGVDD